MSDEPENIVLVYLRRMDANIQELRGDMRDIKTRLVLIEGELGRLVRDRGEDMESRAHLQARVDRLTERLSKIERRLDITD